MGFQDMPEVVHQAASGKGGKIKGRKGFAANPELAREAGRKGGYAKAARQIDSGTGFPKANNNKKGAKQTQDHKRDDSQNLADILGALNE